MAKRLSKMFTQIRDVTLNTENMNRWVAKNSEWISVDKVEWQHHGQVGVSMINIIFSVEDVDIEKLKDFK